MKIVILPNNLNDLDKIKADIVVVGIDKLSWYVPFVINKRNFKSTMNLINKSNKKTFLAVNKLMNNKDLILLKSYLKLASKTSIAGLLFDDPAVYQLCSNMSLNIPLIHFSSHLITNYKTANFWLKKGISGVLLSTEITLDEILSIKSKTSTPLLMYGYGYLPMFVSHRKLITSYLKYLKLPISKKQYTIKEPISKRQFNIYENNSDTIILSDYFINTYSLLPKLYDQIDYLLLSSLGVESNKFIEVANYFSNTYAKTTNDKIIKLSPIKPNDGFLFTKTIYKVKKYEKK